MYASSSTVAPAVNKRTEKNDLIAAVAYALWEDRKRHNKPDDPLADWCRAEQLIMELSNYRPDNGA
jgi:hypothetical protein